MTTIKIPDPQAPPPEPLDTIPVDEAVRIEAAMSEPATEDVQQQERRSRPAPSSSKGGAARRRKLREDRAAAGLDQDAGDEDPEDQDPDNEDEAQDQAEAQRRADPQDRDEQDQSREAEDLAEVAAPADLGTGGFSGLVPFATSDPSEQESTGMGRDVFSILPSADSGQDQDQHDQEAPPDRADQQESATEAPTITITVSSGRQPTPPPGPEDLPDETTHEAARRLGERSGEVRRQRSHGQAPKPPKRNPPKCSYMTRSRLERSCQPWLRASRPGGGR